MHKEKSIGVIGGVGPQAGADLLLKITQETQAHSDSEHLTVILISNPTIPDRTSYILDPQRENPAHSIAKVLTQLKNCNAEVIGIPCNTAHSPQILNAIPQELWQGLSFVNMITEVHKHILSEHGPKTRVGLLATQGSYQNKIYHSPELQILSPNPQDSQKLHNAIYLIKSGKLTQAKSIILPIAHALKKEGAQVIILGCTELPLVITPHDLDIPLIDSSRILARALIQKASPTKLKKLAPPSPSEQFVAELSAIAESIVALLQQKNQDYGDAYKEQGLVGILVRSLDKIHRALNIQKHSVTITKESLHDTMRDLIGYALLFLKEEQHPPHKIK